jgi:hypothetical protein
VSVCGIVLNVIHPLNGVAQPAHEEAKPPFDGVDQPSLVTDLIMNGLFRVEIGVRDGLAATIRIAVFQGREAGFLRDGGAKNAAV